MNLLLFLIISLLLTQTLGQDIIASPRKHNTISKRLNELLDSLFAELSTKNLSIPAIDLGENVGRITNVEGSIPGELQKFVDGYKTLGFTLDTNVTEILLSGYYDILNLDVPGLFPIYGKGNFRISVEAVNLKLCLTALLNALDDKFDFTIHKFHILVQKSTVKFENLMNDLFVTDFLNELISNLIPDLVSMITQPATKLLQVFIDFYGNGIFNCIKTESKIEKIEECIKDLFQTDVKLLPLSKEIKILLPKLAINLSEKLAPKI